METIRKALQHTGGATALARQLGVTPQAVYAWLAGTSQIRASDAVAIEQLTNGKVTAFEIGEEFASVKKSVETQANAVGVCHESP